MEILYYIKWLFKKYPIPVCVALYLSMVITASILGGIKGFIISMIPFIIGAVSFLIGAFVNMTIVQPIRKTFAEYKKEKQDTFNTLRGR